MGKLKKALKKATRIATKPVSTTLDALGTSGGKLGEVARKVEAVPDKVAAQTLERLGPLVQKALKAEQVTKMDQKLAKKLGWNWLEHRTNKTAQSTARASESLGNFINSVAQGTAQAFREGEGLDLQRANRIRLEADRAHVRTNSAEDIQKGIQQGTMYVGPDGQVYDRYGGRIGEKGLAQRGATALQVASLVMPALAPLAAAATAATAARHGTPVGKALAQGALSYYAGQLGGSVGGAVGRGAAQGGVGAGIAAYNAGARGGDLFKETGKGALVGGATGYLGGVVAPAATKSMVEAGYSPVVARALTGAGVGATSAALRGGDVAAGALSGAGQGVGGRTGGLLAGNAYRMYQQQRRRS